MFVHKQVNMKVGHAESQQLKTKYYTQNTTTLRNNQEHLIILVDVVNHEIGIQCV